MSDIIWAISPANDSLENLLLKMREFALEILEPLGINCTFTTEGAFSAIKVDVKKRKDIYLFFKEAVNNAAKYSYCNSLSISMLYRQPFLHLKVEDDGKGFNEHEVKAGNGLSNMRERAAAMGAKILIGTAPGKGTRIALDVSVT